MYQVEKKIDDLDAPRAIQRLFFSEKQKIIPASMMTCRRFL